MASVRSWSGIGKMNEREKERNKEEEKTDRGRKGEKKGRRIAIERKRK